MEFPAAGGQTHSLMTPPSDTGVTRSPNLAGGAVRAGSRASKILTDLAVSTIV